MSLRDPNEQIALEDWSDNLLTACEAAGVSFPDDPAQRWHSGRVDIASIVAELAGELAPVRELVG